jgi:hypothetical protein
VTFAQLVKEDSHAAFSFDGTEAYRIELDEHSFVAYLPSILQPLNSGSCLTSTRELENVLTSTRCLHTELENVLTSTRASLPLPLKGKCTGAREQYYGVDDEELGLRVNPRWLTSAQVFPTR